MLYMKRFFLFYLYILGIQILVKLKNCYFSEYFHYRVWVTIFLQVCATKKWNYFSLSTIVVREIFFRFLFFGYIFQKFENYSDSEEKSWVEKNLIIRQFFEDWIKSYLLFMFLSSFVLCFPFFGVIYFSFERIWVDCRVFFFFFLLFIFVEFGKKVESFGKSR